MTVSAKLKCCLRLKQFKMFIGFAILGDNNKNRYGFMEWYCVMF